MDKVYLSAVADYDPAQVYNSIKEILLYYKMDRKVDSSTTILLKPNMLSRSAPEKAVTTHPVMVEQLIILLKEMGAKPENITVADSGGGPQNPAIVAASYKACGFADVAARQGVQLYTKPDSVTVKTDGVMVKEFELIAPAVNSDIVINLPKFKTHVMTGMSCRVKNLFGCVPGLKKAEFHMRFPVKENFAEMIVDLAQTVKPTLTIVDGITAMEGDGPGGGMPRQLGLVMAGTDCHRIDLAAAKIIGFNLNNPPILARAIKRGLVEERLTEDMLAGEKQLAQTVPDWVLPASYSVDFSHRVPRALRWATPTVEKLLAPKPKIIKSKCIGCRQCRNICPQHTITIKDKKAVINMNNCIRCFCCHEMCPVKAIDVKRNLFFNI